MSKQDGGPAFPRSYSEEMRGEWSKPDRHDASGGMSLRDWFAGQALAGITASIACSAANPTYDDVARKAYAQADAMLAVREGGK